ncbi:MAG: primosomal protein N' [Bacteroidales bacterium]|nr:primosomal protein N' [Bacteroidales bacterium]
MPSYVDVLLPLPLSQTYTYSVPEELASGIQIGCRVIVPLGPRKLYTGIVLGFYDIKPVDYVTKPVFSLLDESPILIVPQLRFWRWLASYYMCSLGEVMKAALPSGLKLESETLVTMAEDFDAEAPLKERERRMMNALVPGVSVSLMDLSKNSGISNVLPVVQELMEKGALLISEGLRSSYKVKTKACVRLTEPYIQDQDKLRTLMDEVSRAKKQLEVLMTFLELSCFFKEASPAEVGKKELLKASGASPAVLQALCARNVLEIYDKDIDRLSKSKIQQTGLSSLSKRQKVALDSIHTSFEEKPVCLLHGLTSSGKTEIYIHLIEECIRSGKQVLYLVPEIALTTQLSDRLKLVFGNKLAVYHSKFPDAERVEIWHKLVNNQDYQVILGVRSSIFLPFHSLGLIIVDEEHEGSYKQQDPAPRYHARNAALILAALHGAKTLLGTATPSLETYFNCQRGMFGLVELFKRHYDMEMPEIIAVNTKELRRKKIMKTLFSPLLSEKIGSALAAGEQVILFQNRRGYAPVIECKSCGWVPKCERCDVSLTLHKYHQKLTCHYCGFEHDIPQSCPSCGTQDLSTHGFGTEQIEEQVHIQFPKARVARMDTDTTRSRRSYEQIIHDFESGETDILIGTQMVTKGLDFDHVRVVGILNADQMLNLPDFRAYERSFQQMAQVSGRAGRKGEQGLVIVQTSDPEQPVLKEVISNDFKSFYNREMLMRKQFSYPPFTRIIQIRFKHKNIVVVRQAALYYASLIRPVFGQRLLGPDQPPIARINNYYLQHLLLKVETEATFSKVKEILLKTQHSFKDKADFRTVQISFDVDPL